MKALITDKAKNCKHTSMICQDCGSFVYNERPGKKGLKTFMAKMRRMRKVIEKETERVELIQKQNRCDELFYS